MNGTDTVCFNGLHVADADGTYSADDFQPFPRSNGAFAADNFWNGGAWAWFNGNPPWDTIGATDVHPNGINNAVEPPSTPRSVLKRTA